MLPDPPVPAYVDFRYKVFVRPNMPLDRIRAVADYLRDEGCAVIDHVLEEGHLHISLLVTADHPEATGYALAEKVSSIDRALQRKWMLPPITPVKDPRS